MAKKLFIPLFLFLSFSFTCKVEEKWHASTSFFFDTVCEIKLFGSSSVFKSAQKEVNRVFSDIERCFSPESDDYTSPLVINLFQRALSIYQGSLGCFDITVSPLSRAWGFFNMSYRLPPPQEIKSILALIGMNRIEERNGTLVLQPGMKLDWGGIAKGFGVDLVYQSLAAMGIARGFINAGGDLYCWGKNPDNQDWKVGIKHPRKSGLLGVLDVSDIGAATTGDYQRFFVSEGTRYHHVFDPHTGYPARGKQSVTVVGPEALVCDALSTALFVSKQPEAILQKYPSYGAIIVDSAGKISKKGKSYSFSYSE